MKLLEKIQELLVQKAVIPVTDKLVYCAGKFLDGALADMEENDEEYDDGSKDAEHRHYPEYYSTNN